MIVLCVTNCPDKLRGDLSKWLLEINTGVYIGRTSARVREELWKRTCEYIHDGQATMIYSSNNVQGYGILVHNTKWRPVDYEGITLMRRPLSNAGSEYEEKPHGDLKPGFSDSARYQMLKNKNKSKKSIERYVILDIETTGLDPIKDRVLAVAAIRVRAGHEDGQYHSLIKSIIDIPDKIKELTGINSDMLKEGRIEKDCLKALMDFIGEDLIVGYNVQFDLDFIREACEREGVEYTVTKARDILAIARKKLEGLSDYRMRTVAKFFGIQNEVCHRAAADCRIAKEIFDKLNEI